MPNRALIIAIEDYPELADKGSLPASLPGTLEAGVRFRKWLLTSGLVVVEDIRFCASGECEGRTAGGTRSEILKALFELVDAGQDTTKEFFVFYLGHGFRYRDRPNEPPASALACQDFANYRDSGDACINLDEVARKISGYVGGGSHFYFIDACRTEVPSDAGLDVTGLGRTRKNSALRVSDPHLLYSVEPGMVAPVNSCFTPALLDGLAAKGRSRRWVGPRMLVTFASLLGYLRDRRDCPVAPDPMGAPTTEILEQKPITKSECRVEVVGAEADDRFELQLANERGQVIDRKGFTGPTYQFPALPDDYSIVLYWGTTLLTRDTPPPGELVDLYESQVVRFVKPGKEQGTVPRPEPPPSGPVPTEVHGAPGTTVRMFNIDRGGEITALESFSGLLNPGRYRLALEEDGWTVRHTEVAVPSTAERIHVDLGRRTSSLVKDSLVQPLPEWAKSERTVQFSETLGNMVNEELPLWLSIVGASRVVGPDRFSKLRLLPLARLDGMQSGQSATYVLAGLEKSSALQIGFSSFDDPSNPKWWPATSVPAMTGVMERLFFGTPGPHLLSFALPETPPLTIVTHGLPNRGTVLALAQDESGNLVLRQLILPVPHLEREQPLELRWDWERFPPLQAVRLISQAQARLARGRDPAPPLESRDYSLWYSHLQGQWLDPMMAILSGYRLLRVKGTGWEPTVVANLRTYFDGIPDIEVVAKLAEMDYALPQSPPMFLDGVLALEGEEERLPLPAHKLDYKSTWTTWIDAVALPSSPGGSRNYARMQPAPPAQRVPEPALEAVLARA
jgi:caspase domain-containing protein